MPTTKRCSLLFKFVLLVCLCQLVLSCHKNKTDAEITGITSYNWKVYQVQEVGDSFINPIPTDWQLKLNADRSFSFNLSGSVCNGTYSWMARDTANATVAFSISSWNNPIPSAAVAEKTRRIVQGLKDVMQSKPSFGGQYPGPPFSATAALLLQGNAGLVYVFR